MTMMQKLTVRPFKLSIISTLIAPLRFESRTHRVDRFTELFTVASYQAQALKVYKDEDAIKQLYILHFGVLDERVRRVTNDEELAEQLMTHVIKAVTPTQYRIATEETGVKSKPRVMRKLAQEIDSFNTNKSPHKRKRRTSDNDDASFSNPLSFNSPSPSHFSPYMQHRAKQLRAYQETYEKRPLKKVALSAKVVEEKPTPSPDLDINDEIDQLDTL